MEIDRERGNRGEIPENEKTKENEGGGGRQSASQKGRENMDWELERLF